MSVAARLERSLDQALGFAAGLDLQDGETLFLTGSAVLPFETEGGDLDLVLITPDATRFAAFAERRHPERLTEQVANGFAMSYVDLDGREVDVEVWPLDRVRSASRALDHGIRDIDAVEADFTRVGGLDVKVGTDLFHAIRGGVTVHGHAELARIRAEVPWRSYQAFKRDCALVNARDATKGIPASLRAGRPDEAYLKLCWAADSVVDGLIFHQGMSISRWKWRLRYLPLLEHWVGQWYRDVRFSPVLEAAALTDQATCLHEVWQRYSGTEPIDAEPSGPPAMVAS